MSNRKYQAIWVGRLLTPLVGTAGRQPRLLGKVSAYLANSYYQTGWHGLCCVARMDAYMAHAPWALVNLLWPLGKERGFWAGKCAKVSHGRCVVRKTEWEAKWQKDKYTNLHCKKSAE